MPDITPAPILDSDRDSVRAAQAGDDAAFADLVRRYTDPIYTLARRTLDDPEDAEDAVQEIFLKAYRSLSRFDAKRRFFPWLYTVAVNHLRSVRRTPTFRRHGATIPVSEQLLRAPDADSPEAQAVASETRQAVADALDTLTPMQRRVFLLRQLQSLSTAETAHILRVPKNTVKTHLRRARNRLAEILSDSETSAVEPAYIDSGVTDDV